jgi:hypothetical protein
MGRKYSAQAASLLLAAVCLAALLPLAGCGQKLPATRPVTGTVRYQGEPVEGATVLFIRGSGKMTEGEMAMGKTDASGRFELTTHVGPETEAKGAPLGDYQVVISKHVPPPGMSESEYQALVDAANKIAETGAMVPPEQQPPEQVEMFPQYSLAGQSGLKASVTADGENDFPFDLK